MADQAQNVDVSADKVHQEGIEHIKDKLEGAKLEETPVVAAEPAATAPATTEATTEATPAAATEATPVAPVVATEPPASNPGAEDATAGIAKDAGGVSSAAPVQTPVSSKRKSIVGTLRGYFTGADKKGGAAATTGSANQEGILAEGATIATTAASAVVVQATQLVETTRVAVLGGEPATGTEANKDAAPADSATDAKAETSADAEAAGEATDGAVKHGDNPATRENRDAIPVAGGEKLGEKHWGESDVVPAVPNVDEETGVASAEGQPSETVKENTAKNTGSATEPPTKSAAEGSEKKEKFFDKVKSRLQRNKKQ